MKSIKYEGMRIIMSFTKEELDAIVPKLDGHTTRDEFLDSLHFKNVGIDYGSIMHFDYIEAKNLQNFIDSITE